jgi:hypothetical protein
MQLTKRVLEEALGKESSSLNAYTRAMDLGPGAKGQTRVFSKTEALLLFTADEIVQQGALGPLPAMVLVGTLRNEFADLFRAGHANLWAFLVNNPEDGQRALLATTTDKSAGLDIMLNTRPPWCWRCTSWCSPQ